MWWLTIQTSTGNAYVFDIPFSNHTGARAAAKALSPRVDVYDTNWVRANTYGEAKRLAIGYWKDRTDDMVPKLIKRAPLKRR